jgi:transcription termination factor Rho
LFPPKGSYSKAKITPVYNEPAPVVTELKAKVDVPAEVSSQIEAVNEGNQ